MTEGSGAVEAVDALGPRPSLMMARESGTSLVCQPLSAWSFSMAEFGFRCPRLRRGRSGEVTFGDEGGLDLG